jgi:hypothetical protein
VVRYVHCYVQALTWRSDGGSAFGSLARVRPNRELERPPRQAPDFLFFGLTMDTIFVDEALQAYREKTGDMRPFEALPVTVTSHILREAQRLKGFRSGSFSQPATADGCGDS